MTIGAYLDMSQEASRLAWRTLLFPISLLFALARTGAEQPTSQGQDPNLSANPDWEDEDSIKIKLRDCAYALLVAARVKLTEGWDLLCRAISRPKPSRRNTLYPAFFDDGEDDWAEQPKEPPHPPR